MTKKGIFMSIAVVLLVLLAIMVYFFFSNDKQFVATEEEVISLLQSQYEGSSVESIVKKDHLYTVVLNHTLGQYELVIDGETRHIASLQLITLHEQEQKEEPSDEQNDTNTSEQKVMLTKNEAIAIALAEVEGVVDDVDIEEEEGLIVYQIEMEINDDDEATVILNAYTGDIISITFD